MRTVRKVAQLVGLPERTVRYYDQIGLVAAVRSQAGYRLYGDEEEGQLRFVKQARSLGFSLDEVRELAAAAEAGCCDALLPELDRLLGEKLAELDQRIADLRQFRDQLAAFRAGRGNGCGCAGQAAFCTCLEDGHQPAQLESWR